MLKRMAPLHVSRGIHMISLLGNILVYVRISQLYTYFAHFQFIIPEKKINIENHYQRAD